MDAIRFYGVRRKLQRLQVEQRNEEDSELYQSDSEYECPKYGEY